MTQRHATKGSTSLSTPRRRTLSAMLCLALGLTVSCSANKSAEDHAEHLDHYTEEPGFTVTNPDDAVPYPERFDYLKGAGPEQVSTEILRLLTSYTSESYDSGSFVEAINGLTTTDLWRQLTDNPKGHATILTGPVWRQWAAAGGTQRVEVAVGSEQHPPDTDTTWARKFTVTHTFDGMKNPIRDTYIVGVEKKANKWFANDIRILDGR